MSHIPDEADAPHASRFEGRNTLDAVGDPAQVLRERATIRFALVISELAAAACGAQRLAR